MALPPGLPPDGNAIQRVRRFNRLKQSATDLDTRNRAAWSRIRREARAGIVYLILVYSLCYFTVDVAFQILLGSFPYGPGWVFGALLPACVALWSLARTSIRIGRDIMEINRTAVDLRHHENELARLKALPNTVSVIRKGSATGRPR